MKSYRDYGIDCQDAGTGQRYCVCPQCSASRTKKRAKALSVNLDKGIWNCHHCGWSGHLEFTDAEKAEWGRARRAERERSISSPQPGLPTMTDLSPAAVAWFESRAITGPTAAAAGCKSCVVFFAKLGRNAEAVAIPFIRNAKAVNWKYRCVEAKDFSQQKGGQQCLYGFDDARQRHVVILTEGELDALALREVEYEATCSCPAGAPPVHAENIAGKLEFIADAAEDVFEPAERVILATDADEPGIRWRDAMAEKIGREKCYTVQYPQDCKDCNDVLLKHGRDALRACIETAAPYPVAGVATFADYADAIWAYYRDGGAVRGLTTGWPTIDEHFRLCPGSMNVVTGIPSSGKSEWLDQLMLLSCVNHNWRWAVYSPENQPPPVHFQKLAEKFSRKAMFPGWGPHMTEADVTACLDYLTDRMRFITLDTGILTIDDILAKVKVCVVRDRINGFLLDPYNEVEHCRPAGVSETEYVSLFLSKVRNFGRTHNVAMFIVAHPTKLQKGDDGRYPVPTPYDISGSAHWRNKADNCISVWRSGQEGDTSVQIHVQKVRDKNIGKTGCVVLYWQRSTGYFACTMNELTDAPPPGKCHVAQPADDARRQANVADWDQAPAGEDERF